MRARQIVISCSIILASVICGGMIATVAADDLQTSTTISVCGDAVVSQNEACDDGVALNIGGYGSTTAERKCNTDCLSYAEYCGDGVLQARFEEQCDDGNTVATDLCSLTCRTLAPAGSTAVVGSPSVGSTPVVPGASPGIIQADRETRVVLRGKAYPGSTVNVLVDGKVHGTVQADVNADFLYTTNQVTPGTATFGFSAKDPAGVDSITTSIVFDVAQSAVSTVANVFFPPTISVSERQVPRGEPLTLSGYSVPAATVVSEIRGATESSLEAEVEGNGSWALQVDTASLADGLHAVKSYFSQGADAQSGFGKSLSFSVGEGAFADTGTADINGDTKVNLVDFSIFLLNWGTDDIRSDFNADGTVNLGDFSIMLFNWTG